MKDRYTTKFFVSFAIGLLLCLGSVQAETGAEADPEAIDAAASAESLEVLTTENRELRREIKRLEGQIAGDTAIDADNRELRYDMMRLRAERARLRQENDELKSLRFRIQWGGSLFLLGLVMGYIVAIRRAKRRFESEMGKL